MDKNYSLKRHTELWENQNKQIKRVLIGGILFAYLLLVNILTPYSNRLDEIQVEMTEISTKIDSINASKNDLTKLEETLNGIKKTINQQPWREEKNKLIRKFAEINAIGHVTLEQYQQKADSTITAIGSLVLEKVSKPLDEFINDPTFIDLMPALTIELKKLRLVEKRWTNENQNKIWFATLDAKEAALHKLTNDLDVQVKTISLEIDKVNPGLEKKIDTLKKELAKLNELKIEEEKKLPEKLDAEMQKILPTWISGIISLKQMMLYPFVIIGIVLYVAVIALTLTSHYHYMTKGLGMEQDDPPNSAFSSLWTLTDRGKIGTLFTLSTYIIFIIVMWFFYEQGFTIFSKWLATESDTILNSAILPILHWVGRLILVSLLAFITMRPFSRKIQIAI